MISSIRKFSRILSSFVFFIVLFNGISYDNPFDSAYLFPAFIKALVAGTLFWVLGFIISDIILKGIIEDIPKESLDVLEGGLIQRLKEHDEKKDFKESGKPTQETDDEKDSKKKKK